jgi:signal transduction histidine kinase
MVPRGAQQRRIIQARVTADRYLGQPPHTLRWLLRDITRQQQEIDAARERQQELTSKLALVEEQERRRLALQIHDNITQSLAVAQLRLGMLRGELPAENSKTIDEIRAALGQALSQIRTLTFELSPTILYDLGLGAAIEWLIERRSGCGVSFTFENELAGQRFRRDIEIVFFQAARELVNNIVRHSHATRATISIEHENAILVMQVVDDGIGFTPPTRHSSAGEQTGLGLPSLHERLSHLRGSLQLTSAPGGGTRVRIAAPVRRAAAHNPQTGEHDATPSADSGRSPHLSPGPQIAAGEGSGPGRNGGGRRRPRRSGVNGHDAGGTGDHGHRHARTQRHRGHT